MAATKRKLLDDENVRKLKPAALGKRYDVWDTLIPHMSVRVTGTGHKSFVLRMAIPGKPGRVRRELGAYPTINTEQARTKARRWMAFIADGVDPKLAEQREVGITTTFTEALEQWLAFKEREGHRKAADVRREVTAYLLPKWGKLPIASITRADVKQLIAGIRDGGLKGKPAPYQAHNILGHVRTLFRWAVHEERFGLEANPAREVVPAMLIGRKASRERTLNDAELRGFWKATGEMAYPYGPLLRLLLLTGCRNSEMRDASWSEFDEELTLLTVPPERFKTGSVHLVPITDDARELLAGLPRFQSGDHLFSATFGRSPVHGLSKAKARLDELMRAELGKKFEPFVVHDLRRSVRTRLAALDVPERIAEMVIGHARRGIVGVYDKHSYEKQMRAALETWAAHLRAIVEPPPEGDNVVPLRGRTA